MCVNALLTDPKPGERLHTTEFDISPGLRRVTRERGADAVRTCGACGAFGLSRAKCLEEHVLRGGCRTEWMGNIRDEASEGRCGRVGRRASLKSRPGGSWSEV